MKLRLAAIALYAGVAPAQPVFNAAVATPQVQITISDGDYKSCGVRVIVFPDHTTFPIRVPDYSTQAYFDKDRVVVALAKFAASRIDSRQQLVKAESNSVYVSDAWLKPQGNLELPTVSKMIRGDDKNTVLVGIEAYKAMEFLFVVAQESPKALIGIRTPADKLVEVVNHSVELTAKDREALSACLFGLVKRIESLLAANKQPGK